MPGRNGAIALWVLLAWIGAVSAAPPEPRVWTDRQGRRITGTLVRVDERYVYLQIAGRRQSVAVPLAQLSDADQAIALGQAESSSARRPRSFAGIAPAQAVVPASAEEPVGAATDAAASEPAPVPRTWTINGRRVVGSWAGADEQAFYLDTASGSVRVAYSALTDEADAVAAVEQLQGAGLIELADSVRATYEQMSGRSFPQPAADAVPPSDEPLDDFPAFDPAADGDAPGGDDEPQVFESRPRESEKPVEIKTADAAFGVRRTVEDAKRAEARFRQNAMLGGLAIAVVLLATVSYSWAMSRRG